MRAQIEITNEMFMHLVGIMGIMIFTILYVSLVTNTETRVEGLSTETEYYNYARRIISSSDCLAYREESVFYTGDSIKSFSRVRPGVIDMSKFFDFNHQNCIRYDMVSGSGNGDLSNPMIPYPVIIYEVSLYDLVDDKRYNFTNSVFKTVSAGKQFEICDSNTCKPNCVYDCVELSNYLNGDLVDIDDTSLSCNPPSKDIQVIPGKNCWTKDLSYISRVVVPYNDSFNCSIPQALIGDYKSGKVFESSFSYPVVAVYPNSYEEHPSIINIHFCLIKVPTLCDPFFNYYTFGLADIPVYQPELCTAAGVPLI